MDYIKKASDLVKSDIAFSFIIVFLVLVMVCYFFYSDIYPEGGDDSHIKTWATILITGAIASYGMLYIRSMGPGTISGGYDDLPNYF